MADQEVHLIKYLKIVWRRRYIVLGGTLLCIILAAVVTYFLPKTYELEAQLEVGIIHEERLNNPIVVAATINSEGFLSKIRSQLGLKKTVKQLQKAVEAEPVEIITRAGRDLDPRRPRIVKIRVRANSPERTLELARAVTDEILRRERQRFDDQQAYFKQQLVELDQKINELNKELAQMKKDYNRFALNPSVGTPQIILYQKNVQEQESVIQAMSYSYWTIKTKSEAPLNAYPTRLIEDLVLPEKPISPVLSSNLLIAFSIGVVLSLIAAFTLEMARPSEIIIPVDDEMMVEAKASHKSQSAVR